MSSSRRLRSWQLFALALGVATGAFAAAPAADRTERREPLELTVAKSFADGGGYEWKNSTGVPCELRHAGQVVLAKQPHGTYCCGFTLAVAFGTLERRGLLKEKSFAEVKQFQKEWYGVPPEAAEKQCVVAAEHLGVGHEVKRLDDARPGDFVQIYRVDKSGHSVMLLELLRESVNHGRIIGLKYRSSQKLTDGIGDRVEYFADVPGHEGRLDRKRIYVVRLDRGQR